MDFLQKMKQKNKLRNFIWFACFISSIGMLFITLVLLIGDGSGSTFVNHDSIKLLLAFFTVVFFISFTLQYFSSQYNEKEISELTKSISLVQEETGVSLNSGETYRLDITAISEIINHSLESLNDKNTKLKHEIERNERLSENISEFYRQMRTLKEADLRFDFFEYDICSSVFFFISGMVTAIEDNAGLNEITGECFFNDHNLSICYNEFTKHVEKSLDNDMPLKFEFSAVSKEGRIFWYKFWGRPSKDKKRITGAITDITREVLDRNIEKERAIHDNITGFYNRNALSEIAGKAISESSEGESIVFIYVGLTGYQEFQERFGMVAGNTYIRECAEVFKKFLSDKLIPLRWWGSDFLVLVKGITDLEAFKKGLVSIIARIEKYIGEVDGIAVTFPLAIGYSVSRIHGNNPSELLEYAAFAEHEALREVAMSPNEFNRGRFEEARRASLRRTFIKDIINRNQLSIVFQPIVSLKTGELFGFEALSRPVNPIYRNIMELIDDAEASGHYAILEKRMVYNALDAYMERSAKFKDHYLFINTAPYATLDEKDYNDIRDRYFGHMKVVFEVIERNRMEPEEINLRKSIVTKAGAKFALDDFGSGYSNHLALLALEPDIVKIDKELVRGIDDDLRKQHMLEDIISYSRYRGTRVLAEGVETQGEVETLCRMGIDYVQGYYTGRPNADLAEPDNKAQEVIRSISRNNHINMKQVFIIVQKSMAAVCEDMGKSLSITTYLMMKMGKCLGFGGEKLAGIVISSMLHDIGSLYKGCKAQSSENGITEDSIFAYLLLKEFFPYPEYARMVLYHHTKLNMEGENINNISVPDEAYLLSLACNISDIILNNSREAVFEKVTEFTAHDCLKAQYSFALRVISDEDIINRITAGDYEDDLLTYLSSLKIGKSEIESIIRTLIYAVTFRAPYVYSHARVMETTASILARMTKQNWNLLEKVRVAALLYNLGMITMDTEVLEKQHSPEEFHGLLYNSLKTVNIILKEAGLDDILDMFNGVIGERTSSETRMLMGKDIIIGSNMLNLSDIFSSLFEERSIQYGLTSLDTLDELKRIAGDGSLYLPMVEMMEDFIEDIEARVNSNHADITKHYQSVMSGFEKLKSRISGNG